MSSREKRTAQARANIPVSLYEEFKELVAEESNVISVSDYLFGMIEERVHLRAIRRSKQKRMVQR
jgi:hypothetical protein